jgi:hypothetical protein
MNCSSGVYGQNASEPKEGEQANHVDPSTQTKLDGQTCRVQKVDPVINSKQC